MEFHYYGGCTGRPLAQANLGEGRLFLWIIQFNSTHLARPLKRTDNSSHHIHRCFFKRSHRSWKRICRQCIVLRRTIHTHFGTWILTCFFFVLRRPSTCRHWTIFILTLKTDSLMTNHYSHETFPHFGRLGSHQSNRYYHQDPHCWLFHAVSQPKTLSNKINTSCYESTSISYNVDCRASTFTTAWAPSIFGAEKFGR